MKTRRKGLIQHCLKIIAVLSISAGMPAIPCALAETVTCDETALSVSAIDIKAEDLIKAIGNECGIKMVLRGEVFTEDVFSVQFENMPIRTGLERILRVVNIPNHMMHFEQTAGYNRVIEVDLIGKKGGEHQLTPEPMENPVPPDAEEEGEEPNRAELTPEGRDQIPEKILKKLKQLANERPAN